jgi:DNA-directed RNA polymerase subunit RPC12/RpoP
MSDDLFAIHCTTCSTRLRVREAQAIGQILACPKCGSMVLVEPPPGFKLEGVAIKPSEVMSVQPAAAKGVPTSLSRETVSDSDFADVAKLFADPQKPSPPVTPAKVAVGSTPSVASAATTATAPALKNVPPGTVAVPDPLPTAPAKPPNKKATSLPTAKPVLDAGSNPGLAGPIPEKLVSNRTAAKQAAALAPPAITNAATANPSTIQPSPATSVPPAELSAKAAYATPAAPLPAHATPPGNLPSDEAIPRPTIVPPHVQRLRIIALCVVTSIMGVALALGVAFLASGRRTAPKPEVVQQPLTPPAVEEPSTEPESAPETTPERSIKPEVDPPAPPPVEEKPLVPEQPVPEEPQVKPPVIPIEEPEVARKNDPFKLDELRKFDEMIREPQPVEKVAPPLPPAPPIAAPPVMSRPSMRKIDIAARLGDKIPKMASDDCPLNDFLQTISNFSTIPISLHPEALPWSRISPASPVKVSLANLTVKEVLKEALAPYRLEPVVLGETVVITRSAVPKSIAYPVGDLTKNDPKQISALVEFTQALAAPESWLAAGGTGTCLPQGETFVVNTPELAHIQVMELLERLRVARGLSPRSKLPPQLFVLEPRPQRVATALNQPLTLNFNQPTLLHKILKRMGSETKLHLLVDWQALAEAGWPMDTETSITLEGVPLQEALKKLLEPMDLGYRVIDHQTLQITSLTALPKVRELEVYRVADLRQSAEEDPAKIMERLQSQFGDSVVMRVDVLSQSLFVLATQAQHAHLRERPE